VTILFAVDVPLAQFEEPFSGVENPPEVLSEPSRDILHLDLGHQIQVEFGPQCGQ
jgi:hypothetical protein